MQSEGGPDRALPYYHLIGSTATTPPLTSLNPPGGLLRVLLLRYRPLMSSREVSRRPRSEHAFYLRSVLAGANRKWPPPDPISRLEPSCAKERQSATSGSALWGPPGLAGL